MRTATGSSATRAGSDNIIYDITGGVSAGGFGHPECSALATNIGQGLPVLYPIGP